MSLSADLQLSTGVIRRLFLKIDGLKEALWTDVQVPGPDGNPVGEGAPGAHVVTANTIALYRFDEHGSAADATDAGPNGLTLTATGSPTVAVGKFTNSRTFNDAGRYFTRATHAKLQVQRLTIAAWVYVASTTQASGAKVAYLERTAATDDFSWSINTQGANSRLGVQLYFTDTATLSIYDASNAAVGWHHVCATWDGTTLTIYVDGVAVNSSTSGSGKTISYTTSGVVLGVGNCAAATSKTWNDRIDDLLIENVCRSAEWVRRTYEGGADYSRPGLTCLRVNAEYSAQLDLGEMTSEPSAMTFELQNIPDPSDPTTHLFAKLFAPGRWVTSKHTWLRRDDATDRYLEANATSVVVQDTDADSWASSGEAHIGQEVFSYSGLTTATLTSGETGNKFTGVTKGLYPCIGTDNWGRTYRFALGDYQSGDTSAYQPISNVPYSWIGRRVALYLTAWDATNRVWYSENDAYPALWVGVIGKSITYDPMSDTWKLPCDAILEALEKKILVDPPSGTLQYQINLNGSKGRALTAQELSGDDVVATCSGTVAAGFYDVYELCGALNAIFGDSTSWTNTGAGTSEKGSVPIWFDVIGETVRARGQFSADTNHSYRIRCTNLNETPHPLFALGFLGGNSLVLNVTTSGSSSIADQISPGYFNSYQPLHQAYNGNKLALEGLTRANYWASQGDYGTARAYWATNKTKFFQPPFAESEDVYVVATNAIDGTETVLTLSTEQPRKFDKISDEMRFIGTKFGEQAIELKEVYVQESTSSTLSRVRGPLELLLYPLLSTGTSGYNNSEFDKLPYELSVGIQQSLVDVQSFLSMDQLLFSISSDLCRRDGYVIHKSLSWRELFQRDAKLLGVYLAWDRGRIRVKSAYNHETDGQAVQLDESNSAETGDWPSIEMSTDTVVNQWECRLDYNYAEDKFGPPVIIADVDSQAGLGVTKTVKIEHPGVRLRGTRQDIAPLLRLTLLQQGDMLRYPWQRITVTLAPKLLNRVYVGDVVTYVAAHRHPDPYGTGAMSVEAAALVLDVSWDLRRWVGRATLLVFSTYDATQQRPWGFSALVDKSAGTNGGWDFTNKRLTLVASQWGEQGDPDDGSRIASGDQVLIVSRNPVNPASLAAGEIFGPIATDAAYEADGERVLTLDVSDLAGWNAEWEYVVFPADYPDQTTSERTENASQASATTARLDTSTVPHLYG